MLGIILKDGTKITDEIVSINTSTSERSSGEKSENITIVFKDVITEDTKAALTSENCETIVIVDYQGNEIEYQGYNSIIMIGNQFNLTSNNVTVVLTKTDK